MSAGYLNMLGAWQGMQRNQNVLNQLSNPQVFNPAQSIQSAMQTAALMKYLKGGGAATATPAMQFNIGPAANAQGAGTTAAPQTTAAPASSIPASTSATPATPARTNTSPGWFQPPYNATDQGGSGGGRYLDLSPGQFQGPASPFGITGSNTGNATANPMGSSSYSGAYSNLAASILRDPSDANITSALSALKNTGMGVYSDDMHNQLLGMTLAQRRAWAQSQITPQQSSPYSPTVAIPSNATSQVRNALTDFSGQTGSGLTVSPY